MLPFVSLALRKSICYADASMCSAECGSQTISPFGCCGTEILRSIYGADDSDHEYDGKEDRMYKKLLSCVGDGYECSTCTAPGIIEIV